MKKICSIVFFCVCSFLCFAQKKPTHHQFTLNGTIKSSIPDAVYFCYIDAGKKFHVDSDRLNNGHFQFRGLINGPTIAFITTVKKSVPEEDDDIMKTDGKNSTLFFLEPEAIKAALQPADFRNGMFTGSYTQNQYADYTHRLNLLADRYKEQVDSLQAIPGMDKGQKEEARIHLALLRNEADSRILHRFFTTHPQSYVTAYLVSISHFKLDSLNLFYHRLPLPVKMSAYGKQIKEKIEKKELVAIGKTAPAFKQATSTGDFIALKDFNGKYVLLQYWSSTNNASRADNRALIPIYNRFKDKNFIILGISLDGQKTKGTWEKAIKKDLLPWTQLAALKSNHNQAVLKYDVQSIPANFLISPNGKILAADLSPANLNQALTKFFKNN